MPNYPTSNKGNALACEQSEADVYIDSSSDSNSSSSLSSDSSSNKSVAVNDLESTDHLNESITSINKGKSSLLNHSSLSTSFREIDFTGEHHDKNLVFPNLSASFFASRVNSVEMSRINSSSFIAQSRSLLLSPLINTDPFSLIQYYSSASAQSTSNDISINKLSLPDRNTAQRIIIDALKTGDDHYYDLVKFLLDDSAEYSEQQNKLHDLFTNNQTILLPIKQHLCILSCMQDILQDALDLIVNNELPVNDINIFYHRLIERFKKAENDYIAGQFKIYLELYLKDEEDKESSRQFCLLPLREYLPIDLKTIENSYFAISDIPSIQQLKEKIIKHITELENSRNNAHDKYEVLCKPVADLEDKIRLLKRERRLTQAAALLNTKNSEIKVGLPFYYKEYFNNPAELLPFAGIVQIETIEEITGSNLALIALQYKNLLIYKHLFSTNKEQAKTNQSNLLGLSADHYDMAFFWKDKEDRISAELMIKTKDVKGELLREAEMRINQYLQNWYKKNSRLRTSQNEQNFLEKIAIAWIKFFNNSEIFEKRYDEATQYLSLVQHAMHNIPAEFYVGLKGLLEKSNWGAIKGSHLHNTMASYLKMIESKPAYRELINPTAELLEMIKKNEKRYEEDKALQELKHQKEKGLLLENIKALNTKGDESKAQITVMQKQYEDLQAQNREIKNENAELKVIVKENEEKNSREIQELKKLFSEFQEKKKADSKEIPEENSAGLFK